MAEAPAANPSRRFRIAPAVQWAVLALAAAAVWYFWPEAEVAPYRSTAPRVEHDGFLAVSYVGVSRDPDGKRITPERLRAHLDAAARAGYSPVTLEDVRAFLVQREPLPRRPLLILFEDGRRETVREADELLGARNAPATLAVHLEAVDRKSFNYPLWRHLRALARTGRWSFAARPDALPAESSALSTAIRDRAASLADRLGSRSDFALIAPASLRGVEADATAGGARRAVREHFALAFAVDDYGFNHRATSVDRLSMLRVDPDWTGEELVGRLDAQGPRRNPLRKATRHDWVHVLGDVTSHDARVELDPRGRRMAEAWLAGTESWRCLSGTVALRTGSPTQSWILFRSGPGKDFVRLGWTGTRVELQARDGARGLVRLASVAAPTDGRVVIDFRLLDQRLRFSVRSAGAEPRSYALPRHLDHGMVGIACWSPQKGSGPVAFEALRLVPARARAVILSSVEALRIDAADVPDVFAPAWYRLEETGDRVRIVGDGDAAFLLAAAHRGASVWPLVPVPSRCTKSEAASLRAALAKARTRVAVDGFLLDLRGRSAGAMPLASFWAELLSDPSIPLGAAVSSPSVQLNRDHADRFQWIAIFADGADGGGVPVNSSSAGHQLLLLRSE